MREVVPGSFVLDGGPHGPGGDREALSSLGSGDGVGGGLPSPSMVTRRKCREAVSGLPLLVLPCKTAFLSEILTLLSVLSGRLGRREP